MILLDIVDLKMYIIIQSAYLKKNAQSYWTNSMQRSKNLNRDSLELRICPVVVHGLKKYASQKLVLDNRNAQNTLEPFSQNFPVNVVRNTIVVI